MSEVHPPDTNFVVTGLARSGTTWMMRCLEAGGLRVAEESWRYELRHQGRGINLDKYKGKCIKYFTYRLIKHDPSNCAILFMKRNPYKIVASHLRFKAKVHDWIATCIRRHRAWEIDVKVYDEKRKECAAVWCKKARSYIECDLEEMDTYEKRIKFFTQLKKQGWPVDPKKASLVENDEEERLRKKERPLGWS